MTVRLQDRVRSAPPGPRAVRAAAGQGAPRGRRHEAARRPRHDAGRRPPVAELAPGGNVKEQKAGSEVWISKLFTQGVAHADEHFWSTLATIKYVGHDIEKNPVVLTRGPSQVGMTRRID